MPPAPRHNRAHYSRYRTSWYIGFGLGGGGGWISGDELGDNAETAGLALSFKVGWVARPWLLLGIEIASWADLPDELESQIVHCDVMATVFPFADRGYYGKVGIGFGGAVVYNDEFFKNALLDREVDDTAYRGFDLRLGLGHEWQLLSSFNLGVELAYGLVAFGEGHAQDLWGQLTFTWY